MYIKKSLILLLIIFPIILSGGVEMIADKNVKGIIFFKTQMIDKAGWAGPGHPGSNNMSMFYGPGEGSLVRADPPGKFNLTLLNDNYVGAYNGSDFGFVFNFGQYPENVTHISIGDNVYWIFDYKFNYFPAEGLNRYFIPFSGGSVTGSVTDHIDALNNMWDADLTVAIAAYSEPTTTTEEPTTTTEEPTTTTTTAGTPGFGLAFVTLALAGAAFYMKKRK